MSEQCFRALFEQSPSGLILYAPNGLVLDATLAVLGTLRREQARGYKLLVRQQLVAAGLMDDIQRAFAGEAVRLPPLPYPRPGAATSHEEQTRWPQSFLVSPHR